MRQFNGTELQTFVDTASSNSVSNLTRRFRLIYDHIESPKPDSFERWLKSTPFADMDHYYFGVYVASFNGANYLPMDCNNQQCTEGTFVTDNVPIMDMVKFKDDKVKAKFTKIYKEETVIDNREGLYVYNNVAINDKFAIAFKQPTLYDYIEALNVDDVFARKYSNMLAMIPYIDNIYAINYDTNTLDPIGYKEFQGNASKTFKSKIRKYNSVLNYLSGDEFSLVEAYTNDISSNDDGVTYVNPSMRCPYCGKETDEQEMTAQALVFTRFQLGALVNTTLK
jgi:hypothetical protein